IEIAYSVCSKRMIKKDQEVRGSVPLSTGKASLIHIARGKSSLLFQERQLPRNTSLLPCTEEHHFFECARRNRSTCVIYKLKRYTMNKIQRTYLPSYYRSLLVVY